MQVIKRNGKLEPFDQEKITMAILKTFGKNITNEIKIEIGNITKEIVKKYEKEGLKKFMLKTFKMMLS